MMVYPTLVSDSLVQFECIHIFFSDLIHDWVEFVAWKVSKKGVNRKDQKEEERPFLKDV